MRKERVSTVMPLDYNDYVRIYGLVDPFTDHAFYVGATKLPLNDRLSTHLANSIKGKSKKDIYIRNIVNAGKRPVPVLLETVHIFDATFFENFYMDLFKSFGYTLLQKHKSNYTERESKDNWRVRYKDILYDTLPDALKSIGVDDPGLYTDLQIESLLRANSIYELKNGEFIKWDSSKHSYNYHVLQNMKTGKAVLQFPYNRYNVERLNLKSA